MTCCERGVPSCELELLVWIIGSRKEKYKKEKQVQSIIIIMSHHKGYPVPRGETQEEDKKMMTTSRENRDDDDDYFIQSTCFV